MLKSVKSGRITARLGRVHILRKRITAHVKRSGSHLTAGPSWTCGHHKRSHLQSENRHDVCADETSHLISVEENCARNTSPAGIRVTCCKNKTTWHHTEQKCFDSRDFSQWKVLNSQCGVSFIAQVLLQKTGVQLAASILAWVNKQTNKQTCLHAEVTHWNTNSYFVNRTSIKPSFTSWPLQKKENNK